MLRTRLRLQGQGACAVFRERTCTRGACSARKLAADGAVCPERLEAELQSLPCPTPSMEHQAPPRMVHGLLAPATPAPSLRSSSSLLWSSLRGGEKRVLCTLSGPEADAESMSPSSLQSLDSFPGKNARTHTTLHPASGGLWGLGPASGGLQEGCGDSDQPLSLVKKCASLYLPRLSQGFSASHCWRSGGTGGGGGGALLCTKGCEAASLLPPLDASSSSPHDDNQECLQTLPNVPCGTKIPVAKNPWLKLSRGPIRRQVGFPSEPRSQQRPPLPALAHAVPARSSTATFSAR